MAAGWLPEPSAFQAIVSGTDRSIRAHLLRAALALVEWPYRWAVSYRNRGFDNGHTEIVKVAVPVISVGNLTLGGTGKTPLVMWLCRWFRQRDVRVCVISRGYRAVAGGSNDEALQLEQNLPDVPHLENPDRVAAAQTAIEELETQLILLDDGFQHRRMGRDLDIVLLDALEPFGYRHVFPRGWLREPLSGLKRAKIVILSRANAISSHHRSELRAEVLRYQPQAIWIEAEHVPRTLRSATGEEALCQSVAGQKVAAFCGIGTPRAFERTLQELGCEVVAWREFPDHHPYTAEDVADLTTWANGAGVTAVLCTEKDLVKLDLEGLGPLPLWAVIIEFELLHGHDQLKAELEVLLERTQAAAGEEPHPH